MKSNKLKFLVVCLLLLVSCSTVKENVIIDLSKNDWNFYEKGKSESLIARVPGSVQIDLLNNKKIPELFFRKNENEIQWIGEKEWVYETYFDISDNVFNKNSIELDFQGLDTYAKIYLNDEKILETDNFFRSWKVDAKKILKKDKNHLKIYFASAIDSAKKILANEKIKLKDNYSYIRKPAYHFGWDWGPILITTGIWKPILLKSWDNAKINDLQIYQKELSNQLAKLEFVYEINSFSEEKVLLEIENKITNQIVSNVFELKKGINYIKLNMNIDNPNLWWSVGLGDPFLYSFDFSIKKDGVIIDKLSKNFGLRTIKLIQNPDQIGKTFYFELNGVPVFAKGANYIPLDMNISESSEEKYHEIIKNTLDANMNMLRVWGGGFYENEIFYDLCDKNGILVWQDFMYACAMYPGDDKFLENAKQEAIENVKRLRNHTSIALWCGNNENYIGWKDWKWAKKYSKEDSLIVWQNYEKLFHQILPDVILTYDNQRDYWPSSPKHGWGYPVNTDGDSHYWGIWHAQEPFEELAKPQNIPRFMSEFGFQGCPEFNSIKKFTTEEDWSIESPVMKLHQKHRVGYPVIDKYLKWYYKWPKDFQSYLYVSQLNQSFGIGFGIETHRAAMPHCMGSLYWQINDLYPVTSWSSIDYYGNWKALHYNVRDLYKQSIIVPQVENELLKIKIVTDKLDKFDAELQLNLLDFNGNIVWEKKQNVKVSENTSKIYFETPIQDILKSFSKTQVVLVAKLLENNKLIYDRTYYFAYPKDLELIKPVISKSIGKDKNGYIITLKSDKLVKNIFLSFEDIDGKYSNNYFDMLPNTEYKINFTPNDKNAKLGELKLFHLMDTY